MKARCKRWIATPVIILILGTLPISSSFAQAVTPCDIELTQPTYQIGQIVQLSVFRLTNSSPQTESYEWKFWLDAPGLPATALVTSPLDLFALPAGFDLDFVTITGPIDLFTPDNAIFTTGTYELGCRLIDPITGEEFPVADVISFEVI